jgi:hypothetical protein
MTVKEFCEKYAIKCKANKVSKNPNDPTWKDAKHYKVTLYCDDKSQMLVYYSRGMAVTGIIKPSEILECILYDCMGIEHDNNYNDWAENNGFNSDSIKGFNVYKACLQQKQDFIDFLGIAVYKQFLECGE